MRLHEFTSRSKFARKELAEAAIDTGIDVALRQKGYKKLGHGTDQNVYLEPGTGLILKIFRTSVSGEGSNKLTAGQQTFKAFADYCLAHPNNQFLPNFIGWETFVFNNYIYLQIRMERLFELEYDWADVLETLASEARYSDAYETKENFIETQLLNDEDADASSTSELLSTIGENGFSQLWDTIFQLANLAESSGFKLDLHAGNFMQGSDGHIVISDPFFIGWGHPDLRHSSKVPGSSNRDSTPTSNEPSDYIPDSDRDTSDEKSSGSENQRRGDALWAQRFQKTPEPSSDPRMGG